ncbi:anthocyanidin 3-O-glucosyltransferase 2-like [Impatiens glandulifera]|uniref:anthocyanidin 3-O-glucosyltransferase 2-like n=1 Tax=Impatiens glandulifera TaxID=253017 RepID=UPI001FB073BC|nr:anthocyanidin 3-O-glucosyltransferase 2-like [Impatiens glandulifera]
MEKKIELICIPSPGTSHIVSMLQMARLMVARDQRISITVLLIKRPASSTDLTSTSFEENNDQTSIRFVHLREPDPSNSLIHLDEQARFFASTGEIQIPIVREAIVAEFMGRPGSLGNLAGILMDMFCACMVDVAKEFQVPSYIYFPSNASCLGLMNHMHAMIEQEEGSEFINSDPVLNIPIFSHPYPANVLPITMIYKNHNTTTLLGLTNKFKESSGIVVNTFSELEPVANRENEKLGPIYHVGPLVNFEKSIGRDEMMRWLDDQPRSSVVFLCFGSMGNFVEEQVKEIAVALERSRCRFIWSLRMSREVLPEGFLERTCELGKLIEWAPQVDILSHVAVGGFVSHCGWNSILESLWYGVSVAAWPLYAEQQMNAFLLVKELELAVEVKMDYRQNENQIVAAEVIENAIRRLMDGGSDMDEMRKRVKDLSETSNIDRRRIFL